MHTRSILVVVGTRPEAIKMAPVVLALKRRASFRTILCTTGQHRELLTQALRVFKLTPDVDLHLMERGQDLATLTARALTGLRDVIRRCQPNAVLVHGDTTTCLAGGLAAFYEHIPLGHVEAGLRTHDLEAPWPEEMNRRLVDPLCRWCFAPTPGAAGNLKSEKIPAQRIFVTGNTAVDALQFALARLRQKTPRLEGAALPSLKGKRLILVTGHRRERFGAGFKSLCLGLRDLADQASDVAIVYPVHLNPNVQEPVKRILGGHKRIHLLAPQSYLPFVWLMRRSTLIITDSGGIQEEAPRLGKPVLVMRAATERHEALAAGAAKLVGANREKIARTALHLLSSPKAYRAMAGARNLFGDGRASEKIARILAAEI